MIESLEQVMDHHKVGSHVWQFGPALPHDIYGFRRSCTFTNWWSNQWWWSFYFGENLWKNNRAKKL